MQSSQQSLLLQNCLENFSVILGTFRKFLDEGLLEKIPYDVRSQKRKLESRFEGI